MREREERERERKKKAVRRTPSDASAERRHESAMGASVCWKSTSGRNRGSGGERERKMAIVIRCKSAREQRQREWGTDTVRTSAAVASAFTLASPKLIRLPEKRDEEKGKARRRSKRA